MSRGGVVAFALLLVGAISFLLQARAREPALMTLPTPEWARPQAVAPLASESRVESPIAEMVPVAVFGTALLETKQEVTFTAAVPLDAGMSAEVAAAVIVRIERMWQRHHDAMKAPGPVGDRYFERFQDYVLAAWPAINEMIREKKVEVAINPLQQREAPNGWGFNYSYSRDARTLTFGMQADRWHVDFTFHDAQIPDLHPLFEAATTNEGK